TCVLKPLHEEAGLVRVRVATYQSVSGAGAQSMERLRNEPQDEHDLRMDWDFDGEEFDEESKLRDETRKIMELPELPIQATCVRVPVMVGHAEAIWLETEDELGPERATELLAAAPSVRVEQFPSPGKATGIDDVLVGRIRRDPEGGARPRRRERRTSHRARDGRAAAACLPRAPRPRRCRRRRKRRRRRARPAQGRR